MTDYQIEDTAIGQAAITGRSLEEIVNDIGEGKAKYWIRKGVDRACDKAIAEIQESIDRSTDPGTIHDLQVDIRTLKRNLVRERLTASAWHRRAE
jgi:hypothetical protein